MKVNILQGHHQGTKQYRESIVVEEIFGAVLLFEGNFCFLGYFGREVVGGECVSQPF